jgi:proline-rich tail region repeat protein
VAGWRYTLALTWVREKEKPTAVLDRLWEQVKVSRIACQMVLLDRYFFTVPVMTWLQQSDLPFIIPVVMRGRKPKPGVKARGMRSCRARKAGSSDYTHHAGTESVTVRLVITYKSYRHRRTKKRAAKKLFFATWKVWRSPTDVRETYRRRFGIETSYRQLNQSRSRTTSRDPLYRFLLVGLALFLRNLWQWLANMDYRWGTPPTKPTAPNPPRYQDILDDFSDYLRRLTQTYQAPVPGT